MIDKNFIADNFKKASSTYDEQATVQHKICDNLANLLENKSFNIITELGCGTGYLSKHIKENFKYKTIHHNDLVDHPVVNLLGDMEKIDIPNSDLIISANAIHWVDDLEKLVKKIYDSLNSSGTFAFSTFGKDNLNEIKDVVPGLTYYGINDIKKILNNAGFNVIISKEEKVVKSFDSLRDMFDEFNNTGVKLKQNFSHNNLKKINEYKLTYDAIYFICIKGE